MFMKLRMFALAAGIVLAGLPVIASWAQANTAQFDRRRPEMNPPLSTTNPQGWPAPYGAPAYQGVPAPAPAYPAPAYAPPVAPSAPAASAPHNPALQPLPGTKSLPAENVLHTKPAPRLEGTPLVVIRFNQPNVYYERPLYTAVSRAVSVKPGVMFDVVSYVPQTGNREMDIQMLRMADAHVKQVTDSFRGMGVPGGRITVATEPTRGIDYDELHIFVR